MTQIIAINCASTALLWRVWRVYLLSHEWKLGRGVAQKCSECLDKPCSRWGWQRKVAIGFCQYCSYLIFTDIWPLWPESLLTCLLPLLAGLCFSTRPLKAVVPQVLPRIGSFCTLPGPSYPFLWLGLPFISADNIWVFIFSSRLEYPLHCWMRYKQL